jgi:hypothetical protein
MSSENPPYKVHAESDRLSAGKPMLVVAVTIVIFAICIVWVLLSMPPKKTVSAGIRGEAPREIQMIEQTLIQADNSTARLRAEQEAKLAGYGWVDRDRGVVHIPIDRAMQLVAGQAR